MKSKYPKLAPDKIESLSMCEVFVFGSNLQGHHTGGAARYACGSLFISPNTLSYSTLLKTTNSKRYKF